MPIRWGIIGCGEVTEVKSGPAFQKASHSQLVAVMRRNGRLAEDYAKRHQVPKWYDNARQLTVQYQIDDPKSVQLPLIQSIVSQLNGGEQCPSTGESAARTNWVMDRFLEEYRSKFLK